MEVTKTINSLKDKKANDIYGFSIKLVKIALPKIANVLTSIFNNSFLQGKFPDKLKYASVTPIHKGGSKLLLNNYRPISILPHLVKYTFFFYKQLTCLGLRLRFGSNFLAIF